MRDDVLAFCDLHGISPTRFAIEAGLDPSVMSKWLRGRNLSVYSQTIARRYMAGPTPTQASRGAYANGRRP